MNHGGGEGVAIECKKIKRDYLRPKGYIVQTQNERKSLVQTSVSWPINNPLNSQQINHRLSRRLINDRRLSLSRNLMLIDNLYDRLGFPRYLKSLLQQRCFWVAYLINIIYCRRTSLIKCFLIEFQNLVSKSGGTDMSRL